MSPRLKARRNGAITPISFVSGILLVLFLAACGTPQVGIERTPTSGPTGTAVLALSATPSAQPATRTATLQATIGPTFSTATSTPTPTPIEVPTSVPTPVSTTAATTMPVEVWPMGITPATLTLSAGDSACFYVSALANWDGQTLPSWSVDGLPPGATAEFKGQTAGNPTSGCLRIDTPCSIAEGGYPLEVTAAVPGKMWKAQITLGIAACEEFKPGVYTKPMDELISVIVAGKPDFINGLAVPLQVCYGSQPRKLKVTIESATSEAGTRLTTPPRFYLFYSLVRPAPDFINAHNAEFRNVEQDYMINSGWSLEETVTPGLYLLVFEHDSYADLVNPREPKDIPKSVTYRLEVVPMPCMETICLTASPMPVAPDGMVTLNWNAPGAVKVEIWWWDKQQESVIHSDLLSVGSLSFSIADAHIENIGAYVYVLLTAHYADGKVESKELYISVRTRHTITAFAVSPQTVNPGEIVTLSWGIAGEVQEVSLYTLNQLSQLDTSYSNLPASGSLTLTVPAWRRNAMSFQLYASDPDGLWVFADTSVKIACPDVWFFPNPPSDCPGPATYTKMAVQHFEHGVMIWTEWEDRIRVFYNDSQDVHLRRWEMRNNEWFPGMPESDPNIVPPPGYYQPVRGFGKLWREGSHWDGTSIRDLLGWAIEPELGIDHGAVQCDASPKYSTCYLGDPVGVVYVEEPELQGWYEWAGPNAMP